MPLTRELHQCDPVRPGVAGDQLSVDFRCLPHQGAEIRAIREACLTTGFFYLDHAFADKSIVGNTLLQMDNFFGLDDDDVRKKEVGVSATNKHGWTPMFGEPAYQPGTIAHLESFDCGRSFRPDGHGTKNAWPDLSNFRGDVRQCWNALARIGDVVLESLALAAGVAPRTFCDRCNSHELSTMRLLHYPANDAPVAEKNVGIAAHTDFECMTLILQTAPGLELRHTSGSWYDAPSDTDRVVVLLGDMLERWTNGQFQATGHRVRNTNDKRYSIVLFFAVNDDESVNALPEFISEDNPARYEPVGQRQHLEREVRRARRHRDESIRTGSC
jgi:isopenicillin N synthase-like dioxygenase